MNPIKIAQFIANSTLIPFGNETFVQIRKPHFISNK